METSNGNFQTRFQYLLNIDKEMLNKNWNPIQEVDVSLFFTNRFMIVGSYFIGKNLLVWMK